MIAATALLASKPVPLRLPECFKAPVQPGLCAVPETRTSVPTTGHGSVSFGILGANRMAVAAPLLRQLLAHTGVAIHDLSGAEMAVFRVTAATFWRLARR